MQGDGTSTYTPTTMNMSLNFPEQQEHLKCPRCESINTKFCYYNNYNLSQPRHFCKNCRRYWTKDGTLRNIPIGGGTRKINKRSTNSNKRGVYSSSCSSNLLAVELVQAPPHAEQKHEASLGIYGYGSDHMEGGGGSFSSLLVSTPGGQFEKLLMDGLNPNFVDGSNDNSLIQNPNIVEEFEINFMSVINHKSGDQSVSEGGDNAWPDHSIYTPGSSFH